MFKTSDFYYRRDPIEWNIIRLLFISRIKETNFFNHLPIDIFKYIITQYLYTFTKVDLSLI